MIKVLLISNKTPESSVSDLLPKGSSVLAVKTYEDAFFHVQTKWDAVMLDVDYRDRNNDSLVFLEKAKALNPSNEIIAFSWSDNAEKCLAAMQHGANNYLLYPFKKPILSNLIEEIRRDDDIITQSIRRLAHGLFIEGLADKKQLLAEFIQARRQQGSFVTPDEFMAFFPLHKRGDIAMIKDLQDTLGINDYHSLRKVSPPIILVVEDEVHVREAICEILGDFGYETLQAESAEDAIDLAKQTSVIDLKLLDIGLPGMSGTELIPILNQIHPDSETIMVTAFGNKIDFIVTSFKHKVFDYITKPFDKADLMVKVSKALQKKSFEKLMPEMGASLLATALPPTRRFKILTDIAQKRHLSKRNLQMKDLYQLFPELQVSGITPYAIISKEIVEDGLLLFVELLTQEINNGGDANQLLENWHAYTS